MNFEKEKITTTVIGSPDSGDPDLGEWCGCCLHQELNGTAGEYAQAEQTEEAAVQTEETEQTEEMTEQSDGTKQSEEIAVQSEATEAVEETTEQTEETQTKTDELRQELLQLLEQKTVMATVYLADLYEVREEPDADSAVEGKPAVR